MKIIELYSENIQRLKAVDIRPNDNIVILTGKNEAGKTSVLDSIEYAMTGKLPEKPIREGQSKATIKIDIGEYIVKKIITEKTTRLEVTTKDGSVKKSPQTILNDLIGQLTFNPLEFASMNKKAQRDLLLKLLNIDFSKLDKERQEKYDERTIAGRDGKDLAGQAEGFKQVDFTNLPDEEIVASNLSKQLSTLNDELNNLTLLKRDLDTKEAVSTNLIEEIAEFEKLLEDKKKSLSKNQTETTELSKKINQVNESELKNRKNEIEKQIDEADLTNERIRKKKEFVKIENNLKEKRDEYQNLTNEIKSIDNKKIQMIENAIMPIEGLSFDDESVLYNKIPFSQLSSAQKLRVSMAMAMAMNPKLRVIRITDGSLLDSTNMKIIEEMAKEKDYQVWIERVDESGEVGIYIEEGEVKNIKQEKSA